MVTRRDDGDLRVVVVGEDADEHREALATAAGLEPTAVPDLSSAFDHLREGAADCLVVVDGVDLRDVFDRRWNVDRRLPLVLWLEDLSAVPSPAAGDPFVACWPSDAPAATVAAEIRGLVAHRRQLEAWRRQERALDDAPMGITISDPDRPDNPIIYANEGFERLTGYPVEEVLGRNCRMLQGPDTDESTVAELRDAIDAERHVEVDVLNYRKDGTPFWNHLEVAPVYEDGEVVNYVGYQKDVTERVEKTRRLEERNEQLEAVTSVMSHDIRNPLSVAKGHVEMAADGREPDWAAIEESLDRIEAIVEDALVVARVEEPDRERVDLSAVARDAWQTAATGEMALDVGDTPTVRGDRSLLSQLLENLYRNAREHGEADTVTVGRLPDGFYVGDDGTGIPAENREEVLRPGVTTAEKGTGLGLFVVRRIADIHGWSVSIAESDAGGTRVEFTGVKTASQ